MTVAAVEPRLELDGRTAGPYRQVAAAPQCWWEDGAAAQLQCCTRQLRPQLDVEDVNEIAAGRRSLDQMIRQFIQQELSYRFVDLPDGTIAALLEASLRRGASTAGRPFLNLDLPQFR